MQESKPEAPKVAHTIRAGHASNPQPLEIHTSADDPKPWDLDSALKQVKGRHPRLEAPQKVTGRAKYTYDLSLPGILWGKMVRAAVPAGEIVRIDTAKAEALPGVKAVWTTESRYVRFAGQDVAAVAATTPELAADAARLIEVSYNEKSFVTDLRHAMEADAPAVFEEGQAPKSDVPLRGNVRGPQPPRRGGARGDVDKGLAESDASVEATYYLPVHTH